MPCEKSHDITGIATVIFSLVGYQCNSPLAGPLALPINRACWGGFPGECWLFHIRSGRGFLEELVEPRFADCPSNHPFVAPAKVQGIEVIVHADRIDVTV